MKSAMSTPMLIGSSGLGSQRLTPLNNSIASTQGSSGDSGV